MIFQNPGRPASNRSHPSDSGAAANTRPSVNRHLRANAGLGMGGPSTPKRS